MHEASGVNWEISDARQNAARVGSRDKYDHGRQISHKTNVLAARTAIRTTPALTHLIPYVTHLFSRVSAEILTYAGHYPTYRIAKSTGRIIVTFLVRREARQPAKIFAARAFGANRESFVRAGTERAWVTRSIIDQRAEQRRRAPLLLEVDEIFTGLCK